MMSRRGIRNHNPGNIKESPVTWDGEAALHERTQAQLHETTFTVFRAPYWGIRAMAKILLAYQRKHHIRTVEGIIRRWAPSSDSNPTKAYAQYIANQMGVRVNQVIDVEDFDTMKRLVQAIVFFENGIDPYVGTCYYDMGLVLAGVEPNEFRPLA